MRASSLLAVLLLTGCPDPDDADTGDGGTSDGGTSDGGSSDGGSSDGGGGSTTGDGGGTTTGDGGGTVEEHFTTPPAECADGGDADAVVCYTLSYEGEEMALRRLDPAPGTYVDVARTTGLTSGLRLTLYVDGDAAWLCQTNAVTRWDLATGLVERGAGGCESIARHADGFVVADYDTATIYPTLEDAFAGTGGVPALLHDEVSTWAMTSWGDLGMGSWHSTDEIELFHWSTGAWNRSLVLEDWDTWVMGMSATGGSVMMLDDGRSDSLRGAVRLAAHDLVTGQFEWERRAGVPTDYFNGLHCGCVEDAGVTWTDNDLDGVQAVEHGGTDCDDSNPTIHPGAVEACDEVDQDCDGEVDEDACSPVWSTSADLDRHLTALTDISVGGPLVVPDLTGDGINDLLVDEIYADIGEATHAGRVWLVPGPIDAPVELTEVGAVVLQGDATYGYLGSALASLGDIDGDGHDDIAVGAPGVASGSGKAYVVCGPLADAAPIADAASLVVSGIVRDQYVGHRMGRVDGLLDGDDALVVDAPRTADWSGAVHLFPLHATGSYDVEDATASLYSSVRNLRPALERSADLDGDGVNDLLLGVYDHADGAGAVLVWPGTVVADAAVEDLDMLVGWEFRQRFGSELALLGDTDSDGYQDFAVTSAYADDRIDRVDIFTGPFTPELTSADAAGFLLGNQIDGAFGDTMSGPGDLDGDGHEDLVVGERRYLDDEGAYAGAVHIARGPFEGHVVPDHTWVGAASNEALGSAIQGMGDITGDGLPDVLVDSPGAFAGFGATWFIVGADDL